MELSVHPQIYFLLIILIFLVPTSSWSAPNSPMISKISSSKNLRLVASQCVHLTKKYGSEAIINRCTSCRSVGLTRRRPGIPAPIMRRYTIPANSKFPTPFRGPGQTRITSDTACKGSAKAQSFNLKTKRDSSQNSGNRCVALKQMTNGQTFLVNSCHSCRGVAIERMNSAGRSLGRQIFKLKPLAASHVDNLGASRVGLIGEVSCKG